MNYPKQVKIREVGPRDGLQSINKFIPTEEKIKLINCLIDCGVKDIEVTSFVSPKAVPQLQDAEKVVGGIKKSPDIALSALVANVQGVERALNSQINKFQFVISVSETHNMNNTRQPIDQSLKQLKEIINISLQQKADVSVALATAFGCPFEGATCYKQIFELIKKIVEFGVNKITLADTASMVELINLETVLQAVKIDFPKLDLALHLHAPRGLGMDSILTALEYGVDTFETSIGGLGGCPFIPNAVGNIATEALVTTLHLLGINTGIDLFMLKSCAASVVNMVEQTKEVNIDINGF